MARRFRKPSKSQVFGLLMVAALAMMFAPRGVFGWAGNVGQVVALPQLAARLTSQKVAHEIRDFGQEPVPAAEHARVVREKAALENEAASLHQKIVELEARIADLTHIRQRGFPAGGVLIPARVVAADAVAGRDSLLLGKGSLQRIKSGDWVASRLFVEAGMEDGVRDQLAVLAHECLLGWVEQTASLTSRVVLLSDPLANKGTRVRIAPRGGKQPPLKNAGKDVSFSLAGDGRGRMKIQDIPRDYVESKRIQPGDIVTSDPRDPRLPIALVIGQITELRHNRAKPVYYDAAVRPVYEPGNLSEVYIVDLSTQTRQAAQPAAKPAPSGRSRSK